MFLIFGFRTKVHPLGWVAMACHVCGQGGRMALFREVTKFSLFFIPLIPVRSKYVVECANPMCRSRRTVSKSEAQRLLSGAPSHF
ncbi:zinc-ribbon domain-containing protein [Cryptosporangium sp. NPDC048952]|uniref:zinc-ribbon domain-containing protein n=1 Tax=Cryptosporangium sp. NPDC048952 TaxID=3363961 RepID=UPI003710F6D9